MVQENQVNIVQIVNEHYEKYLNQEDEYERLIGLVLTDTMFQRDSVLCQFDVINRKVVY